MYREQIVPIGHANESVHAQSFAEPANATQLREKILNKIPGLWVAKRGRQATFTADHEVGWTLFWGICMIRWRECESA